MLNRKRKKLEAARKLLDEMPIDLDFGVARSAFDKAVYLYNLTKPVFRKSCPYYNVTARLEAQVKKDVGTAE